jgi:hypothetical protein
MIERFYYRASISKFLVDSPEEILGKLAGGHNFTLEIAQRRAWLTQIENLKSELQPFESGEIFLEFSIPRMGKRVDVVLLISGIVFVLEYKVGTTSFDRHALDQAVDYALDLKNFHEKSHDKYVAPILVATRAKSLQNEIRWHLDRVAEPLRSNGNDLQKVIQMVIENIQRIYFDRPTLAPGFAEPEKENASIEDWAASGYKPTPTIVESAQALYQGHAVEDIARSDAGVRNLTHTSDCISQIIRHSREARRKSICFVTGVPGSGKTLAGLNISTRKVEGTDEHAVFLSGNGPLVSVLREALARDEVERAKAAGTPTTKTQAIQKVSAFIQNIHHFRDEGLKSDAAPVEHVVVFDEAQRAWNQSHAEKFMIQKRGVTSFEMSEPEFLISLMDRRSDWCTIVCLVGGGQEINTGEAGLIEWFEALKNRFRNWDVYHSDQLTDRSYSWGQDLGAMLSELKAKKESALHLAVSIRSYRAEKLSDFVGAVIDGDTDRARDIYSTLTEYPLVVTRSIGAAREWLREHARGTERLGLVASSGALRLKPEGVHVKAKIDPANWFLNGKEDVRSSYYLEDVATEFDIQGLELDWVGLCWDADLRVEEEGWGFYAFKGTRWQNVNDVFRRTYLANAYRVLLTRARQGMVIFVPEGDAIDHTRQPEFYDGTFEFLKACGIEVR